MNASPHILVFSPFYPPHTGGLESHSDEFNKHLSAAGISITVFTPRLPKSAPEHETLHTGVRIIRFPAFELLHNYPVPKFWRRDFWRLWHTLPEQHFDIIISRTRFFFPSIMALWYAHRNNIPLLHIEHGSDFAQFNGTLKTALGKLYDLTIGRIILLSADAIVGNSQASLQFVQQLSGRIDGEVIYRGANAKAIGTIEPNLEVQKKYSGKIRIAFIGRLIDGKGVHDLILSLAQLKRNDIVTFIIGDGPEESRLKHLVAEHALEDQVVFFGNLPFTSAISILKVADIVVNPSYTEGLPTSVTEAALCQKAIIATDVGGTHEIISGKDDGYLIELKNRERLAATLIDLIDQPEKRHLFGRNAYKKVVKKFDWEVSIKKFQEIFNTIARPR